MAKIELGGEIITFTDGICHCSYPVVQAVLQTIADEIPGWMPGLDNQAAIRAAETYGARVIELDPPQDDSPGGGCEIH